MVGPTMCFHNYVVDNTAQKRKKKDLVAYLGGEPAIGDVEPSNILVLFPLLLI
jgi:hypothetical protein